MLWFLQDGTFFLVPHVTFTMLNGLKGERKLGLVFIMTNSFPGLFMHQTSPQQWDLFILPQVSWTASDTEVPGQYQLKPGSMWPVLGTHKASIQSSSYTTLYSVLQTSTHAGTAQNPFI